MSAKDDLGKLVDMIPEYLSSRQLASLRPSTNSRMAHIRRKAMDQARMWRGIVPIQGRGAGAVKPSPSKDVRKSALRKARAKHFGDRREV